MEEIRIKEKKVAITLAIVSVIGALLVAPFAIVALPWTIMDIYALFMVPVPPEPQIKQAEFPFTLTYELNGENKTIEDTLICKYDGTEINEGDFIKRRTWTYQLKSGGNDIVLLTQKGKSGSEKKICIGISPEFYMGDTEVAGTDTGDYFLYYLKHFVDGGEEEGSIGVKRLYEKYGVKIIHWSCAPPIENTFS